MGLWSSIKKAASSAANAFNEVCDYFRYDDGLIAKAARGVYSVSTFGVDIVANVAVSAASVAVNTIGRTFSESDESWQKTKNKIIEKASNAIDSTVDWLDNHGVNTQFVGNVIECACLVPSLKGIGKTCKQLRLNQKLCTDLYKESKSTIKNLEKKLDLSLSHEQNRFKNEVRRIDRNCIKDVNRKNRTKWAEQEHKYRKQELIDQHKFKVDDVKQVRNNLFKEIAKNTGKILKDQINVGVFDFKQRLLNSMSSVGEFLAKRNPKFKKMLDDENIEATNIMNNDINPYLQRALPDALYKYLESIMPSCTDNQRQKINEMLASLVYCPVCKMRGCRWFYSQIMSKSKTD